MQKELEQIIAERNVTTVFQPIFDVVNQSVLGYEALTRSPENSFFQGLIAYFSVLQNVICYRSLKFYVEIVPFKSLLSLICLVSYL